MRRISTQLGRRWRRREAGGDRRRLGLEGYGIWTRTWTSSSTFLRALGLPSSNALAREVLSILPHRIEFKAYDDVEPAIRELRQKGYRLIVISNISSLENLSIYLARTGLKDYFDLLVASGSVGFEKPDPGIFRLASGKVGVSPERIVHVGDDYEADYLGAEAAGLRGVLLDRKGAYRGKTVRRISKLTELPSLLARSEFWL